MKKVRVIELKYFSKKQLNGLFKVIQVRFNKETDKVTRRTVYKNLTASESENKLYKIETGIIKLS